MYYTKHSRNPATALVYSISHKYCCKTWNSVLCFQFCQANDIDFLTMRVYIGFWLLVIALVVCCLEGSVFVKMFTRFTEEIFASLISLLYIVESCQMLFSVSSLSSGNCAVVSLM